MPAYKAFSYPQAYRTSNALDRLMNYQDRILYSIQYFHGHATSALLYLRSMAMIWNFHPYSTRACKDWADCHRNHNGNRQSVRQQTFLEIEQVKYIRAYIPGKHKYQWEKDKCKERTENILNRKTDRHRFPF